MKAVSRSHRFTQAEETEAVDEKRWTSQWKSVICRNAGFVSVWECSFVKSAGMGVVWPSPSLFFCVRGDLYLSSALNAAVSWVGGGEQSGSGDICTSLRGSWLFRWQKGRCNINRDASWLSEVICSSLLALAVSESRFDCVAARVPVYFFFLAV